MIQIFLSILGTLFGVYLYCIVFRKTIQLSPKNEYKISSITYLKNDKVQIKLQNKTCDVITLEF